MFTLLECVSYFEMACLANGLHDRKPQPGGTLLAMATTVEAVEKSGGVKCLLTVRVGNAQCALLYIDVNGAVRKAVLSF